MASRLFARRSSSTKVTVGVIAALMASVALNVVQAHRLGAFAPATGPQPEIGKPAPRLKVTSLDGRAAEIIFGKQPTILYYFSPHCPWCEKNWLNIRALMAATEGRYRFIGLSTTADVSPYLRDHRLSFDVYTGLNLETARQYHFGATPHTVVVGADGTVQFAWAGAYVGQQQHDVEHALGLTLPGVQSVSAGK
jgi:peroxiredoxin